MGRERIDEHAKAFAWNDDVVLGGAVLYDQTVLEATATTGLDAYAKPTLLGGHALGVHKLLYLDASVWRDGEVDFRL